MKFFTIATLAAAAGWFAGDQPAAAQAVSYPWCTQGEAIHCYYTSRQQCEETVNYHGFCIPNPDYAPARGNEPRRERPR